MTWSVQQTNSKFSVSLVFNRLSFEGPRRNWSRLKAAVTKNGRGTWDWDVGLKRETGTWDSEFEDVGLGI